MNIPGNDLPTHRFGECRMTDVNTSIQENLRFRGGCELVDLVLIVINTEERSDLQPKNAKNQIKLQAPDRYVAQRNRFTSFNWREAALRHLGLNRGRQQVVEQLVRLGALSGFAHDHRALLDGRIEIAGDYEIGAG